MLVSWESSSLLSSAPLLSATTKKMYTQVANQNNNYARQWCSVSWLSMFLEPLARPCNLLRWSDLLMIRFMVFSLEPCLPISSRVSCWTPLVVWEIRPTNFSTIRKIIAIFAMWLDRPSKNRKNRSRSTSTDPTSSGTTYSMSTTWPKRAQLTTRDWSISSQTSTMINLKKTCKSIGCLWLSVNNSILWAN